MIEPDFLRKAPINLCSICKLRPGNKRPIIRYRFTNNKTAKIRNKKPKRISLSISLSMSSLLSLPDN
jgi:hypothetical protein